MIIVKIHGGIGNQLFQYAIGYKLSKYYKTKLFLDISEYNKKNIRQYELDKFNIVGKKLNYNMSRYYKIVKNILPFKLNYYMSLYPPYIIKNIKENIYVYEENIKYFRNDIYLDGYWQSEKYFINIEKEIKNQFNILSDSGELNQKYLEIIKRTNSVSVHFRRGDYLNNVNNSIYHQCSFSYYKKAIQEILSKLSNICIFVFSDDIEWVKEKFKIEHPCFYMETNKNDCIEDLRLMSNCKHNIIANSTFSWWGAWLNDNKNKIVIAPKKWYKNKEYENPDLLPQKWIQI